MKCPWKTYVTHNGVLDSGYEYGEVRQQHSATQDKKYSHFNIENNLQTELGGGPSYFITLM